MPGRKIFTVSAIFAATTLGLAASPDYFPLKTGNRWVYHSSGRFAPQTLTVEVTGTEDVEGVTYFRVAGFQEPALLRVNDEGTLVAYDAATDSENVWVKFGAEEGETYDTQIEACTQRATMASRSKEYKGPAGEFADALRISYMPRCADAGLTGETYAPSVGLVRRSVETFAGEIVYELVSARVGGTTVTPPEVGFSLALDRSEYLVGRAPQTLTARITLRNTRPEPLPVTFSSSQRYDLILRNENSRVVYAWSADKSFAQVIETEEIAGEKDWIVVIPLNSGQISLPEGNYVAEARLPVTGLPYTASVPFSIRNLE